MIHETQNIHISQKQNGRNMYAIMETMCPLGYYHSDFVATHALGHRMYGFKLLVPLNQRVLNKLSKEHSLVLEDSFVHWYQQCVTVHHVPKCMTCHKATEVITGRTHSFHNRIYITPVLLL